MTLTLEEIAKRAGVSRSTVSRVLNDQPNVSAQARERVLKVTRELNFQPNVLARSLVVGRTRIIGLVIPVAVASLFSDPYFPILIQGIAAACNEHEYSVMLWLADPEQERHMINKIIYSGLVDGVILASSLIDDPLLHSLREHRLPFVLIGRHPADDGLNYVDVDNRAAACEAVAYLLRLGYQRVATITGPSRMIAGHDRRAGYVDGVRARGLSPQPELMVESDFTEGGGYVAMQQLLARAGRSFDAVFVASDTMALGALRALREAGLRVPQDLALIGFDDVPFAARSDPPLTTVRQPIQRTGGLAAETLFDLIENPGQLPRRIVLPTELVIRASTGRGSYCLVR